MSLAPRALGAQTPALLWPEGGFGGFGGDSPWVPDMPTVSGSVAGGFHLLLLLSQGCGLLLVCDKGLILHRGL